ncbi:hypothetical protein Lepto1489_12055 [Leptospira interrogans serovar Bataviae]|uniref:Uncharacterized protein n=1 Tax=Leptospira interrogans serovar Bataviae TaxID=312175 RepID=A0AAP9WKR6_LEPIR|nr:hypothetical protein Lepto1489_12055 [Leptospira interrogans serovar Bataviae]
MFLIYFGSEPRHFWKLGRTCETRTQKPSKKVVPTFLKLLLKPQIRWCYYPYKLSTANFYCKATFLHQILRNSC